METSIGDAVVGVFGLTQTREDDALRAVRAAVELRDAVASRAEDRRQLGRGVRRRRRRAASRSPRATRSTSRSACRRPPAAGEILLGELTCRLAEGLVRAEPLRSPAAGLAAARPGARRGRPAADLGDAVRRARGGARRLRSALEGATRDAGCRARDAAGTAGDREVAPRPRADRRDRVGGDRRRRPLPALRRGQLLQPARRDRPAARRERPGAPARGDHGRRRAGRGDRPQDARRDRARPASRSRRRRRHGRCAGCSSRSRAPVRSSWSSTTSTGPARPCSTCSSTWPRSRPACRS